MSPNSPCSASPLYLLIWKNFITKIRHPFVLIFEIGIPCCFTILLAYIRMNVRTEVVSEPLLFRSFDPDQIDFRNYTELLRMGIFYRTIFYTPNTREVKKLISRFGKRMRLEMVGFESENEMLKNYTSLNSQDVLCGIVIKKMSPREFHVKLRFPFSQRQISTKTFQTIDEVTWQTNRLFPLFQTPGARGYNSTAVGPPAYYSQMFLRIQARLIAIHREYYPTINEGNDYRIFLQRMPYPPHAEDDYAFALQFFFPLILMLSFLYPSVNLTKIIVLEKEKRFTSMSMMMGLSPRTHWMSHFWNSFIINMISIGMMVIILSFPLGNGYKILAYSDPSLIAVWIGLYNISCIMFCFMMSAFFVRSNIAGVVTGAVFFLSFLPYYRLNLRYGSIPLYSKIALSFIFNTNMSLGAMLLSMWECKRVGLRWNRIMDSTSPDDKLNVFTLFCTSITNSAIYLAIALYVSNVFPGECGIPQPWNYFLTRQYWCGTTYREDDDSKDMKFPYGLTRTTSSIAVWASKMLNKSTTISRSRKQKQANSPTNIVLVQQKNIRFQGSSSSENRGSFILTNVDRVSKSYDNGISWAVREFSMQMEENEITVLLGHNGAGKSTLMAMLCGMLPPTEGNITVFGLNYKKDIDIIRRNIGICPQFDILFDDLTVREHLYFYCVLKHVPKSLIDGEIKAMIEMLDLVPKADSLSSTLSGGMKRKLSVGISLIGGSKFVILDEPTSGMDVSARRHIWNLLLKEKKGRSILLSTHFMEEADVLGDKIAIIENGQLKCFGTPMELKAKYGSGYLLTISIKIPTPEIVKKVQKEVTSHIPDAKCLTHVGTEVIFSLKTNQTNLFTGLFKELEENAAKLEIENFGISVTTIEEVFFRVGNFAQKGMEQFNEIAQKLQSKNCQDDEIIKRLKRGALVYNTGFKRTRQIFKAMFVKKMNFAFHNSFLMFAQYILPPVILIFAIINSKDQTMVLSDSPELIFNITDYKALNFVIFKQNISSLDKIIDAFKALINNASLQNVNYIVENIDDDERLDLYYNYPNNYLIELAKSNEIEYNVRYMFGLILRERVESDANISDLIGLYNNEAFHAAPTIQLLLERLKIYMLQQNVEDDIQFSHHPFPRKASDDLALLTFDSATEVQLCNALSFSVSFLLGSFVILIVTEMNSNFRHIQQISSLNVSIYWVTHFILDYVFWAFAVTLLSMVLYLLEIKPFNGFEQTYYVFISLLACGFAGLPYIYLMSFFASDPTTGYIRLSLLTVLVGVISFIAVLLFLVPEFHLTHISQQLEDILQFFIPIFTLQMHVFSISKNEKALKVCNTSIEFMNNKTTFLELCKHPDTIKKLPRASSCCKEFCNESCMVYMPYWEWEKPGSLQFLFGYFVQGIMYWILLSLVEIFGFKVKGLLEYFHSAAKAPIKQDLDSDVMKESQRILKMKTALLENTEAMWVRNLRKDYGSFTAVNDISFGVKKAECFGILGVNGAGKTTTFKMITGAETITSGDIYINKMSVKNNMKKIYKIIGYCPQFNGLLEELTGRQTLHIISSIRGIKETMIDSQIDVLAKLLYFEKNIDHPVQTYSGGTKRKLSVACSIVGNPMIVFLDEPSTGVDPVSRRCLWNAVQALRTAGSSIVLTSHSMEECEALCNRLIIMVNAQVRCIGSTQHLKCKFGVGYVIQIKCFRKARKLYIRRLIDHLQEHFKEALTLQSNHNKLLTFKLRSKEAQLSDLFGYIESLKQKPEFWIEDYSINQTSLERVFLSFAEEQK